MKMEWDMEKESAMTQVDITKAIGKTTSGMDLEFTLMMIKFTLENIQREEDMDMEHYSQRTKSIEENGNKEWSLEKETITLRITKS